MKNRQLNEKVRRPMLIRLILALASLRVPGLGQIICGHSKRGFMLAGAVLATFIISKCSGLMSYPTFGIITFALFLLIILYGAFDAYKLSYYKNNTNSKYGKWIYFLICGLIIYLLQYTVITSLGYKSYYIPNNGNDPTLQLNDAVIVKFIHPQASESKIRSSFILFNPPVNNLGKDILFVKRVIAVAGDTFSIKNGTSYLNNKPLNEPYVLNSNNHGSLSKNFGPVRVPDGYVFVLGDNRDESADSRYYGFVPVANIKGRVLYILLSTHLHKIGIIE